MQQRSSQGNTSKRTVTANGLSSRQSVITTSYNRGSRKVVEVDLLSDSDEVKVAARTVSKSSYERSGSSSQMSEVDSLGGKSAQSGRRRGGGLAEMSQRAISNNVASLEIEQRARKVRQEFKYLAKFQTTQTLLQIKKEEDIYKLRYLGQELSGSYRGEFEAKLVKWFLYAFYESEKERKESQEPIDKVLSRKGCDHLSVIHPIMRYYQRTVHNYCRQKLQGADLMNKYRQLVGCLNGLLERSDKQNGLRTDMLNRTMTKERLISKLEVEVKKTTEKQINKELGLVQYFAISSEGSQTPQMPEKQPQPVEVLEDKDEFSSEVAEIEQVIKQTSQRLKSVITSDLKGQTRQKLLASWRRFAEV